MQASSFEGYISNEPIAEASNCARRFVDEPQYREEQFLYLGGIVSEQCLIPNQSTVPLAGSYYCDFDLLEHTLILRACVGSHLHSVLEGSSYEVVTASSVRAASK